MYRFLSNSSRYYKKLFTPGPLSVSNNVRESMVKELGSREPEFIQLIERVHQKMLSLAELDPNEYCSVLMQGSGTYGVESGLQTIIPDDSRVFCLSNGAYGNRVISMVDILGVDYRTYMGPEDKGMDLDLISEMIEDYDPSHVLVVHCETSTGMINPVKEIGEIVKTNNPDCIYFSDAMSSFGGVEFNMKDFNLDMMVTSVNKCVQGKEQFFKEKFIYPKKGVPGFSIVFSRIDLLENDYSRSMSLSIPKQYKAFLETGQFRFTPAVEVLLALDEAVSELEKETISGREARYKQNYHTLRKGIEKLGYEAYLEDDLSGHIINSFLFPDGNDKFDFLEFYEYLLEDGFYIYPGKVTNAEVFRVGTIGEIYEEDISKLLLRIQSYSELIGLL